MFIRFWICWYNYFVKSLNKFLNIKLYKSCTFLKNGKTKNKNLKLNLADQIKVLESFELFPIKLRFFYHFLSFIHTNLKFASNFPLCSKILNQRNISKTVRFPVYSNYYKFSFTITTIKLLNLFLHNYLILTKKDFSRTYVKLLILFFFIFFFFLFKKKNKKKWKNVAIFIKFYIPIDSSQWAELHGIWIIFHKTSYQKLWNIWW